MEKNVKKVNLLIIGNNIWCIDLVNRLKLQEKYNIQYIYNYRAAIKRLRHNSYDVLLLQQQYFNYNSVELSKLSYAMSRPSIILCKSYFKMFIYWIWKHTSQWANKHTIAKEIIHFKYLNYKSLDNYIEKILYQHDLIDDITKQIKKAIKK